MGVLTRRFLYVCQSSINTEVPLTLKTIPSILTWLVALQLTLPLESPNTFTHTRKLIRQCVTHLTGTRCTSPGGIAGGGAG